MSAPLVSPAMLAGLKQLAEPNLTTQIRIFRRVNTLLGSAIVSNDLGDDSVDFTETDETMIGSPMGWISSTPTPIQVEESGALVTVNTYQLLLKVGTDILPGDRVDVGDSNESYTVSDTTGESTWKVLLSCSLRKRD